MHTDRGTIACETVVNCGGMFAAEIGRMLDVRLPLVPMSHQYVVTEALPEWPGRSDRPLPTLRDPDLLVYYRQEVDGLVMGGYERHAEPWTADARSYDAIPADFNGRLLPENWDRFEEITANSQVRVPAMADAGLRKIINGPEAFTPDNEFLLGETDVDGFFVAAGFCAHGIAGAGGIGKVMAEWIVSGDPGMDLWHMDVTRFGRQYRSPSYTLKRTLENYETYYDIVYPGQEREAGRPLRTSPAYGWHQEHGASFGEKSGWERVNWYDDNAPAGDESLRPRGWAGPLLVARDRRRARGDPRGGVPVRRVVVREGDGDRSRRRRSCSSGCATTTSRAMSATSPTRRRSTSAAASSRTSPSPASRMTRSWWSPARRTARTTCRGCAGRPAVAARRRARRRRDRAVRRRTRSGVRAAATSCGRSPAPTCRTTRSRS